MRQTKRSISGVLFLLLSNSACVVEVFDEGIGDEVDDTGEDTSSSSTGSTSEESTSESTGSTSEESTSEESTSDDTTESETTSESTSDDATETETETESTGSTSEESTSESTSDDATETEEDTFDTFFIPEGDIGGGACDPFGQDCPDGEKCVAYASQGGSWDANKCVPVLGNQAIGEACVSDGVIEATDDCDASGFCFFEVCTGFCGGSPFDPVCPPAFGCVQSNEGSINACMPECDPLAQDCAAGQGCYFVSDQFLCLPTTADGIPAGEPCGFLNDCAAGLTCIDESLMPNCLGPACCSPFCDLQGGNECAAVPGTACGEFTPEVGVCLLP